MIDIQTMLPDLRKLVGVLAEDLLARSNSDHKIDAGLKEAFHQIEQGGRTGQAFEVWREDYLDQVAVAWVLACIFVRFMEDNHLIDECWLAGVGERRRLAEDTQEIFFREHKHDTDREYLQYVFKEVGKIPAAKDLFVEGKTPLWAVSPSGDAARDMLKFWREQVEDMDNPPLKRSFKVESGDTRFLGDLYQELSERAKKKYALLQTPVFVEEFILDRTLTPAIAEFGLEKVRMIDPTCGSGHFLLGGFARLFDLWCKPDHTTGNVEKDAQRALNGVWGVDINPFAVAIARFRLIVAAVQACGIKRLKQAPGWNIHLASGDSLLFGNRWDRFGHVIMEQGWLGTTEESWAPDIYACEEKNALNEILGQQYHVVVGNPPYIRPKDPRLNEAYRTRYPIVCHRLYSLAVPFAERFFDLCLTEESQPSGYVGMITANSFMKRVFGKKLIEAFFPTVDLTHVVDTSGAYIPGHTTSTVILFGRNRLPSSDSVRAVLGIKGEPGTPDNPALGKVWTSIVRQIDRLDSQDDYISTTDYPRSTFGTHPWSIGGGGASDLKEHIDAQCELSIKDYSTSIGPMCITKQDDVFPQPHMVFVRHHCEESHLRPFVLGESVRDWLIVDSSYVIFPYDQNTKSISVAQIPHITAFMWPFKTILWNRKEFGGQNYREAGRPWHEYGQIPIGRMKNPLSIAFPEIATHNHFTLDHGGKVFNQTSPLIKLNESLLEDEYYALLGLLNSSSICFWLKQVIPCKGLGGQGGGIKPETWSRAYVFNGMMVGQCPVPAKVGLLAEYGKKLDLLAREAELQSPRSVVTQGISQLADRLANSKRRYELVHRKMVAIQEELDWKVYALLHLCEETSSPDELLEAGIYPEERPVEQKLRQRMEGGETSIYYHVHKYRGTGQFKKSHDQLASPIARQRMQLTESCADVRLIEQLDYKRRWQVEPWEQQLEWALNLWLLDRIESPRYIKGTKDNPVLTTTAQMADVASVDSEFLHVASLYRGRPDFDIAALVAELVEAESVPLLPFLRYKSAGLRKRAVWERTWGLQRQQDAGKDVGNIPVPPKYVSADFVKAEYWRLRGKLDVPKERWVSYPHCSTDSDPTLVVGWAGWNHLAQATALVAYYDARKREGWDSKRLTPLLAGLDQLLPWIHQWHPEIDPEFGETAGQSFQTMLEHDAHELGLTLEDIRNWTPPEKARKVPKTRKKKAAEEDDE